MATMSARYTVIDGEVIAQERGGVRHQLVPDPLGSTVALYDDSGTKTDTFEYWPYGESAGRTGTTVVTFQYVGSYGYYQDNSTKNYVRARYLDASKGKWVIEDLFFWEYDNYNRYLYNFANPVSYFDSTGYFPQKKNVKKPIDWKDESMHCYQWACGVPYAFVDPGERSKKPIPKMPGSEEPKDWCDYWKKRALLDKDFVRPLTKPCPPGWHEVILYTRPYNPEYVFNAGTDYHWICREKSGWSEKFSDGPATYFPDPDRQMIGHGRYTKCGSFCGRDRLPYFDDYYPPAKKPVR